MRKLMTAFLASLMVLGGAVSIAMAQPDATPADDAEVETADVSTAGDTAFARGFDQEASYFSDRGDRIAAMAVIDIERGWQDFGQYYELDPGTEYVAVVFEISSTSRGNLVIEPYDFSLIDDYGRNNSRSFVGVDEESDVTILEENAAVASGETIEFTIIFELYEEAEVGYFMWQPASGIIIMIDLTEV